jgi:hypothetical protein
MRCRGTRPPPRDERLILPLSASDFKGNGRAAFLDGAPARAYNGRLTKCVPAVPH